MMSTQKILNFPWIQQFFGFMVESFERCVNLGNFCRLAVLESWPAGRRAWWQSQEPAPLLTVGSDALLLGKEWLFSAYCLVFGQ